MADAFCTRHRIAYRSDLDPVCPQCAIGGGAAADQLKYDDRLHAPLNDAGQPLDKTTLKPLANVAV